MATKQEDGQQAGPQKQARHAVDAIGQQVIHILGRPMALYGVQVRPLWGNHYRANILVGVDASSLKVAHSFFVSVDVEGKVIASTPEIRKQY